MEGSAQGAAPSGALGAAAVGTEATLPPGVSFLAWPRVFHPRGGSQAQLGPLARVLRV